jgi:hypothetical protein
MRFLAKVRVNPAKIPDFGRKLQKGELDRRMIQSETYCLFEDPAVGYSVWEAKSRKEFDAVFSTWEPFYSDTEISEVVSPNEAMQMLMKK